LFFSKKESTVASRESRSALLFLLPSLFLFSLYVLFPIGFTFYLSFTNWDGLSLSAPLLCLQGKGISGFQNYIDLFTDDIFYISLWNNVKWMAAFVLVPIIGFSLTLFLHAKGKLASVYKSLFFAPMVFSLVVVGLVWGWFLQPHFGLVEYILKGIGILGPEEHFGILADPSWVNTGVIVTAMWPQIAYCMILYLAGLSALPKNIIEAARIDGVSKWQMIWHVVLPMLRPATVIVVIVTAIASLRAFDLISIMTQGGPFNSSNVLAHYMYEQTFMNFRYGYGAAIGVILFIISFILITVYLKQMNKAEE
jgi:multiple sugar transport system permease protein